LSSKKCKKCTAAGEKSPAWIEGGKKAERRELRCRITWDGGA
jgi:hypothetical protein